MAGVDCLRNEFFNPYAALSGRKGWVGVNFPKALPLGWDMLDFQSVRVQ
jgi:hypothetical protein